MKIELGKHYLHHGGRKIRIAGEVVTIAWGDMWVVEERDSTGAGISCVEKSNGDLPDGNWVEIGEAEWLT